METNPFEVALSAEFESLQEESIDFYMLGIKRANKLSWQFNPWYHRLPNYIISLIPKSRPSVIYDEGYIGQERRHQARVKKLFESGIQAIRIMMMTKTRKLPIDISEEEQCNTLYSCCSLSDVAFRKTSGLSSTEFSRLRASNITSIFSKSRRKI